MALEQDLESGAQSPAMQTRRSNELATFGRQVALKKGDLLAGCRPLCCLFFKIICEKTWK